MVEQRPRIRSWTTSGTRVKLLEAAKNGSLMKLARRTLLRGGAAVAAAILPLPFVLGRDRQPRPDTLVADPKRLLDLAPGFHYRVLQKQFAAMNDGYRVPALPDGMACFAGGDGTLILMRNHEISVPALLGPYARGQKPPAEAYDASAHGGVTRVVLDATTLELRSSNLVLTGTARNCSGGSCRWGWLSCEESLQDGHGYVFLCSTEATRVQPPRRITGYGRFNHEAVCLDPATQIAYLTEDRSDGALYRFVPRQPTDPFQGRLQALRVVGRPKLDTGTAARVGERLRVDWVDIDVPDPADDSVRHEAQARGAALFRRGEGIVFDKGAVYVCATSGGPVEAGQIFKLSPSSASVPDTLELIAQSTSVDQLDMPDNLTIAPWGDVIVAEDGSSAHKYIRGIRSDGGLYDIARNAHGSGELAGVCFSPDGRTLFFNMHREGLTVAVSGPFAELIERTQA
jgi:hypothetical protein